MAFNNSVCPFMSKMIFDNGVAPILTGVDTENVTTLAGANSPIKIQPFSIDANVYFAYTDCISGNCQLWNDEIENCSISFKSSQNTMGSILGTLDEAAELIPAHTTGTCDNCGKPSTILNLLKHVNKDHMDSNNIPYATLLISEHLGKQDVDGNGEIYGVDFGITDSDDKPTMLYSIENSPDFPSSLPYYKLWSTYVNEIEN